MWNTITRCFNSLLRNLWGLLKEVFSGALEMALAELKDFAQDLVKEVDLKDLTNEEKRKEVFDRIKEEAEERAITIKDSAINLLIEICVAKLKQ